MDALTSLALATFAFVGTHLLMSHPLRAVLVGRLGAGGFAGIYSLIAAATLLWMILAFRAGEPRAAYWQAPPAAGWAVSAITLIACILLVGSVIRNPAFPHPGAAPEQIPPPTGVFAISSPAVSWSSLSQGRLGRTARKRG